jgi:DNA-binding ferritin-like protein
MIEQLISRAFHSRNVAHWSHWRAKGEGSYAQHQALGEFYDAVIDALDPLVEAYQGAFDLIGSIPLAESSGSNILKVLENDAVWIEEQHEEICRGNRAVANLIDNLTTVYLTAIYKLRNLR